MSKKTRGLKEYRFSDNPEEKRFAEAWANHCGDGNTLAYLLDVREEQTGWPQATTEREEVVAATVVQWLGSPVGRLFLRDLGYEKREEK